jgi:hypothetical protein
MGKSRTDQCYEVLNGCLPALCRTQWIEVTRLLDPSTVRLWKIHGRIHKAKHGLFALLVSAFQSQRHALTSWARKKQPARRQGEFERPPASSLLTKILRDQDFNPCPWGTKVAALTEQDHLLNPCNLDRRKKKHGAHFGAVPTSPLK